LPAINLNNEIDSCRRRKKAKRKSAREEERIKTNEFRNKY